MEIVLADLGFGDSGKGNCVNFLASLFKDPVTVFRYNGGSQAAHNVLSRGKEFCFHSFGSASLHGCQTVICKNFILDPIHARSEWYGCGTPRFQLENCLITTPLHKLMLFGDKSIQSTCDMGIGRTREYWIKYGNDAPCVMDVNKSKGDWINKIELMVDRIYGTGVTPRQYKSLQELRLMTFSVFDIVWELVKNQSSIQKSSINIWEPSQGVLLDQNMGIGAPDHATWSNTTMRHSIDAINNIHSFDNAIKIGVIRAYHHRHGTGPLDGEPISVPAEKHNLQTQEQGPFRTIRFSEEYWNYAIEMPDVHVDFVYLSHCDCVSEQELNRVRSIIGEDKIAIESWGPDESDKKIISERFKKAIGI